jgi:hypothetical protein
VTDNLGCLEVVDENIFGNRDKIIPLPYQMTSNYLLEPREESIQDYWGFYIGKYCKLIII